MKKVTILLTALALCLSFGILSASYNPSVFIDISAFLENNPVDSGNSLPDKTAGNVMISNGTNNAGNGGNHGLVVNEETSVDNPNYFYNDDPSASQNSPVVPPAIPEPGTLFLVGMGLVGAGMIVRKK